MPLNLNNLTKKEILDLWNWKCVHGHRGISHYGCYLRENGIKEKIGFIDIEASNLKATFGIILSYCILPEKGRTPLMGVITKRDFTNETFDRRVVESCVRDMRKFDRLVGHYSKRFDIPFIRSRALYHGLDFPEVGEIKQTDTWEMCKKLLCLHSNRQLTLGEFLNKKTLKTPINSEAWLGALQGKQKHLDYILDHNIRDVIELRNNYNKLAKFVRRSGVSV